MEKMGPRVAVFNNHLNNAHERAVAQLERENPAWADEMRAFKSSGIMAIFNQDPTPATSRYVELVTDFVNEGRD